MNSCPCVVLYVRSPIAADRLYLADLGVRGRVAVGARRELENVDHQLQRVVDPLICGPNQLVIDEEADAVGRPLGGVGVPLRGIEVERDLLHIFFLMRLLPPIYTLSPYTTI